MIVFQGKILTLQFDNQLKMDRRELVEQIYAKGSYLCVGLDTDPDKLPDILKHDPDGVFTFNKAIIDATRDHCVAYKINTAFYEAMGSKGWDLLERTAAYLPDTHFRIADAKRGDIGNTSAQYAKAFLRMLPFDSVTIAPYMGADSVQPFLAYEGKWGIVLGLTSNKGAEDFELKQLAGDGGPRLYEEVLRKVSEWGHTGNLMFVVGATQAEAFTRIREIIPDHFLLVPGVGAQGGSLEEISRKALNADCGLLVNASRAIQYASAGSDFAEQAESVALGYRSEMTGYLLPRIGRIGREPV
jgi:orotidine-5'-phosphate decarboxylase